jgi:guanylate kinase
MNKAGKLIIVLGPTGSGKSVLVEHVRALHPEFVAPVSCTTRAMRPNEKDGANYHFVDDAEFKRRIAAGDFLEWAQYGGHYYGSLKTEILPNLAEGKTILDELEVQGARQVKEILPPEQFVSIFIDGGSWGDLERRVRARAPITETELEKRKKRYEDEVSFKNEANFIVKNPEGEVETAKNDLTNIIESLLIS